MPRRMDDIRNQLELTVLVTLYFCFLLNWFSYFFELKLFDSNAFGVKFRGAATVNIPQ